MKTEIVRIVIRLPLPLNEKVRAVAKRQRLTINKLTRQALQSWLKGKRR